ncbi:kinase-like domain-containing protein [Podospora fimiseda]|uniref:Altered inheritance of mitochondria protein 9, mitochondrial n=1 Tax=Podospora fimiseda TaxID=252190 RepID=A0AAN6YNX8_9PEZI|nr:kinase-like domain-containing protein [Podospora fimiseda]
MPRDNTEARFTQSRTSSTLHDHKLSWKNNERSSLLEMVWPRKPYMAIARKIAIRHLPPSAFGDATQISTFSEGAFHRLFLISSPLTGEEFIFRVALPVDPFFKTESEVATMDYVRLNSPVHVPRVIAYSFDASNELGFEWILMEKVNGVQLAKVEESMSVESKICLAQQLANVLRTLWAAHEFDLYGNLYYADIWNQVNHRPTTQPSKSSRALLDSGFVIGRIVNGTFFGGKRLLFPCNRGPFKTTAEFAAAEVEILSHAVHNIGPIPNTDYYCESDEALAKNKTEVLSTLERLSEAIQKIYSSPPANGDDVNVLRHEDMSSRNVLVDPETYDLVSIIDWESVSILPAWLTQDGVPYCLRGIEVE